MDGQALADSWRFDDFLLDACGLFRLDEAGAAASVPLGSRAFDLLRLLVAQHGELVSKDAIMSAVWPGTVVEEGNLTVQISALRRVLDQSRAQGSCIQTVPGRGYRFVAAVARADPAVASVDAPVFGNGLGAPIASRVAPRRLWLGARIAVICALAVAVAWAVGNWPPSSTEARTAPPLSIVVLPFGKPGNDPVEQDFGDGLAADLAADLSRVTGLFVISSQTAFTYRDRQVGARQIGRELGVRYVLEGRVRRSGDQIRVNTQLIDAETNAHLWTERWVGEIGDLSEQQDAIVRRLAVTFGQELVRAAAARPTPQPDALAYSLRARAVALKPLSRENYREAIDLFEQALALDPQSPDTKAMLAATLIGRAMDDLADSVESARADKTRAAELVAQALGAAPRSAMVQYANGQLLRRQRRYEEAAAAYDAVIALDRNSAHAYANLGRTRMLTGAIEETIPLHLQAIRLSPRDPGIGNWYYRIGLVHLLQSRTDEAVQWLEKARNAAPGLPYTHSHLAAAYALKGDIDRAAASLAEAQRLNSDGRYASIARLKQAYTPARSLAAAYDNTVFAGLRLAGMPEE